MKGGADLERPVTDRDEAKPNLVIREAEPGDLPAVAALAAELVRQHHSFDAQRFLLIPNVESGYARYFESEIKNPRAAIFAAVTTASGGEPSRGQVVGYAYGRLEPRDWNALLDACAVLHDLYVAEEMRRQGIARSLVAAVRKRMQASGAPRLVLHTASQNRSAHAFFAALGFRQTMLELTCEL